MKTRLSPRGLCLALFLALLAATPVSAQQILIKDSPDFLKAFQPVVAKPSHSTVQIFCKDKSVALGTIVKSDGLILTVASELDGTPTVKLPDGKRVEAKVIAEENHFNLALLKVETTGLTPVAWRPSKEVAVGSWAVSVGTGKNPVAVGVVSVPLRKLSNGKGNTINPSQGYLGVNLSAGSKEVRVEEVVPKSGASKGGMKAGDIIVGVAGKDVTDGGSLKKILQGLKPGKTVDVTVKRGESEKKLTITLGPRPESRNDIQNKMGSKLSKVKSGFPVILQHDSIVKTDECGGPLVDLDGKAIGINVARAGRTESYAIPTEAVLPLLDEMYTGKHSPKTVSQEKDKSGSSN